MQGGVCVFLVWVQGGVCKCFCRCKGVIVNCLFVFVCVDACFLWMYQGVCKGIFGVDVWGVFSFCLCGCI